MAGRHKIWRNDFGWWTEEEEQAGGTESQEIPYILHMLGQTTPRPYKKHFLTIATRCILVEILSGKLRSAEDVATWLRHNQLPAGR